MDEDDDFDESYDSSSEPDDQDYGDLQELEDKLNENQQNILREKNLKAEKLSLLLKYNAGGVNGSPVLIDEEIYRGELNRINAELLSIETLYDEINESLVQKEIEFTTLLDQYITNSKKGIKLSEGEINDIKALQTIVNGLMDQYFESLEHFEPEDSHVYDYDSQGYIENWDYHEAEEIKELTNVIKKYKLKIRIPKEEDFKNKGEFTSAWNKFWKFVSPYIPAYETKMNVTKLGTTVNRVQTKSMLEQVNEYLEDAKKSKVKLDDADKEEIEKFNSLKKRLSDLESNELIDCIVNSKAVMAWSYIDSLRNNKTKVVKINERLFQSAKKEPTGLRKWLIDLASSLGLSVNEDSTVEELQNIIEKKYNLPPKFYYNSRVSFNTTYVTPTEEEKTIKFTNQTRTPTIRMVRMPVPRMTELNNKRFYENYLPIPIEGVGEEIWTLPFKLPSGKYILMKFDKFEDYLAEMKKSLLLLEQNEIVKDKIFQIDQYLEKGITLPAYNLRKDSKDKMSTSDIPGVSYITKWQRKVSLVKLQKVLTEDISKQIEEVIYAKNEPSEYFSKLENILFMLNTHREFKEKVLSGEINPMQLAMFYKEFLSNVGFKNIDNRSESLNKIKKAMSVIDVSYFRNSKILKDIIIGNASKKIELLVYDLSENANDYNFIINKLLKLLFLESFSKDLIKYDVTQLIPLIRVFKSHINDEIVRRSKKSYTPLTKEQIERLDEEQLQDYTKLKKRSLRNISDIINLKEMKKLQKFNLKEIESMLSQERLKLKEYTSELEKYNYYNSSGEYVLLWNPDFLNEEEKLKLDSMKVKAMEFKKKIYSFQESQTAPKIDTEPKDINKHLKELFSGNKSLLLSDSVINGIVTKGLNKYKNKLMKKYRVKINSSINNIQSDISKTEKYIETLQKARIDRRYLNVYRKDLMQKYFREKKVKQRSTTKPQRKYKSLNYENILQVVYSLRRKLIIDYFQDRNKVIDLLEIIDLNELALKYNNLSRDTYERIKRNMLVRMEPVDFIGFFNQAVQLISEKLNITLSKSGDVIQQLLKNWPKEYIPQRELLDYYGEDVFLKLLNASSPYDFYDSKFRRTYDQLVTENTRKPPEVLTKLMVIYNPNTKKFGKEEAADGYFFDVYRLEENPSTHVPIVIDSMTNVFNPRLGIDQMVPVKTEKPGKTYFFKLPIINPNDPTDTFRWIKAKANVVGMYPLDYDTCTRFKDQENCNKGVGLGGEKCKYDLSDKKCKVAKNIIKKVRAKPTLPTIQE